MAGKQNTSKSWKEEINILNCYWSCCSLTGNQHIIAMNVTQVIMGDHLLNIKVTAIEKASNGDN